MIRGTSYTIDLIFNAEYDVTRVKDIRLTIGNYDVCSLADGISNSGQHFLCSIPSDITAVLPVGERSVTLTMEDTTDGVRKAIIATIPIQNTGSQYENENISETANMTLELTYMVNNISSDLLITDVTALRAIAAAAAAKVSEDNSKVSEDNAKQSETNAAQSKSDALALASAVAGMYNTVVADAAQVALDRIATGEDAAQTALDRIATGQDAQTATTKAGEASDSAAAALQSKNYASGYADTALQAKIDAEVAKSAAQLAKTNAETAETNAEAAEAQTLLYKNAAAAIVSGGPRGVYATLADLISANPDHTYTYVVTADGHWYYWNGSTFSDGGEYQTPLGISQTVTTSLTNVPCGNAVGAELGINVWEETYTNIAIGVVFQSEEHLLPNAGKYTVRSSVAGIAFSIFYSGNWHTMATCSEANKWYEYEFAGVAEYYVAVNNSGGIIDSATFEFAHNGEIQRVDDGFVSRSSQSICGNVDLGGKIKELYIDSDETNMLIKVYSGANFYLQIYDSTQTTLIAQFPIDLSDAGGIHYNQVPNGVNAWVVYNDFTFISEFAPSSLRDKVTDINNFPIITNNYRNGIIVVAKNGGGDYASLLEGILAATQRINCKVEVRDGTYDLISEFESYYGGDFFTNYTSSSIPGIILKNGVNVIFSSKAKVVCNYTGNNVNVMTYFSPFNASVNGFTLDNIDISAAKCRYCVHDERGNATDAYRNIYKSPKMYLDNSQSTWKPNQCIGGGLGINGIVRIYNGVFESEETGISSNGIVSYHNSASADAQNLIELNNCYFKGDGTFRFSWYGASVLISTAKICGCSFGSAIENVAEGDATVNNTEVIEWNNEVRV